MNCGRLLMHQRKKWQATPVFLLGESQGRGSLVGCRLWGRTVGHDWSDLQQQCKQSQLYPSSSFTLFMCFKSLLIPLCNPAIKEKRHQSSEISHNLLYPIYSLSLTKSLVVSEGCFATPWGGDLSPGISIFTLVSSFGTFTHHPRPLTLCFGRIWDMQMANW